MTQIIIAYRNRQNRLKEKLEKLIDSIDYLSEKTVDLIYAYDGPKPKKNVSDLHKFLREISKATYKPKSVIILHFPYLNDAWRDVMKDYAPFFLYAGEAIRSKEMDAEELLDLAKCGHYRLSDLKQNISQNEKFLNQGFGARSIQSDLAKRSEEFKLDTEG